MTEDNLKQQLIEEIQHRIKSLTSRADISDDEKAMIARKFFQALVDAKEIVNETHN